MLATIMNAIPFLRGFNKPRRGLYDNPHPPQTSIARAWDRGRAADDFAANPYPKKSDEWYAWKDGDKIRQRVETTIW